MEKFKFVEGEDYYLENGSIVLTEGYLRKRGKCCGSFCRHCVFFPPYVKGNVEQRPIKNKIDD